MDRICRWNNWLNHNNKKIEGGRTMFNVEDRVIVVKNEYEQFIGLEGVVKEITKSTRGAITYGIVFDDLKVGHDLDGRCVFGKGWYLEEDEIELANKSKLCRMVEKNEDLLQLLKEGGFNTGYNVRKNGALTFLTRVSDGSKVFVYKDGANKPLILNCISEDDRIVALHLMEAFRILPMHTIVNNELTAYNQEANDILEATMFPVEVPVVDPVLESFKTMVSPETPSKVYQTEEEIYAELGITKQ